MDDLTIHQHPELDDPVLLMGLSGWMDGGNVSTGTIAYLQDRVMIGRAHV